MRSFHRAVFDWRNGTLLDIEWAGGASGAPVSVPPLASVAGCYEELEPDVSALAGIPAICWREEEEDLFEPLQLREETDYFIDVSVRVERERAERLWKADHSWPLNSRLAGYYSTDPPKRWRESGGQLRLTGRLNFASHVGVADISPAGAEPLRVEVVPRKIGYFADFRSLLDLIADELLDLVIELDEPTALRFGLTDLNTTDPRVILFHLRRVMSYGRLPAALEAIIRRPHTVIVSRVDSVELAQGCAPAPDLIVAGLAAIDMKEGGPLQRLFRGYTPRQLPEAKKRETSDTLENRYVKAFLQDLAVTVDTLGRRLKEGGYTASGREVQSWRSAISDWLDEAVWRDVGAMADFPSNSQVLQRAEGYREVLAADVALQLGLRLPWDRAVEVAEGIDGDIRPMSELYEYWCFFVLRSLLRDICGAELCQAHSAIRRSKQGLVVDLRKGRESRLQFLYRSVTGAESTASLFYNRRFARQLPGNSEWNGSYSGIFTPDFSLLVEPHRNQLVQALHWLHFDAKYRLDQRTWRAAELPDVQSVEDENLGLPLASSAVRETLKRDTLHEMHSYRDALLGSRGAYVLFPGPGQEEDVFIRHPGASYDTRSCPVPGVGAFQLRPRAEARQEWRLRRFIATVLDQLTNSKSYVEEQGPM